jgi:hypothetical protein
MDYPVLGGKYAHCLLGLEAGDIDGLSVVGFEGVIHNFSRSFQPDLYCRRVTKKLVICMSNHSTITVQLQRNSLECIVQHTRSQQSQSYTEFKRKTSQRPFV